MFFGSHMDDFVVWLVVFVFGTDSWYLSQADIQLMALLLPELPKNCGSRHEPPCPACHYFITAVSAYEFTTENTRS